MEGTYITRPYPADGTANKAPTGISADTITFLAPDGSKDGSVVAHFSLASGVSYSIKDHRPGILLVDNDKTEAVFLDYHGLLSTQADASGNLTSVTLRLPAGTQAG